MGVKEKTSGFPLRLLKVAEVKRIEYVTTTNLKILLATNKHSLLAHRLELVKALPRGFFQTLQVLYRM
jgi:hypothetical protein